jgi:serine/threonine-protein kinase HipA
MSISGVQDKISLKLERGGLVPTDCDGEYILKPVPSLEVPRFREDIPANEHLTMQLASQVFGIEVAVNACVYFANGELAYLVRRFDRRNGEKVAQEDLCQLSNRSEETHGRNYKYDATYEECGRLLQRFCAAHAIEVERLFRRILFCYVCSNGDAHLKNFSLRQTEYGDYVLTPAYDLLCTSLHFPTENRTALDLFDDFESEFFSANGFYGREDFLKLAELYGMRPQRAATYLDHMVEARSAVAALVERSFLSEDAKAEYSERYRDRLRAIAG